MIGCTDVDRIDVIACDQCLPVRFVGFVSPVLGELLDCFFIAGAARLEDRLILQIEETVDFAISIGMGPAEAEKMCAAATPIPASPSTSRSR